MIYDYFYFYFTDVSWYPVLYVGITSVVVGALVVIALVLHVRVSEKAQA